MRVLWHKRFKKRLQKLPLDTKNKAKKVVVLFMETHFHPSLRNHALHGEYLGFRSLDVTGDYRILFQELSDGMYELVELIDIGSHSDLY